MGYFHYAFYTCYDLTIICVQELVWIPFEFFFVRSKLLPLVHPDDDCLHGIQETALLAEFSHTMNAVFTDPNDQVNSTSHYVITPLPSFLCFAHWMSALLTWIYVLCKHKTICYFREHTWKYVTITPWFRVQSAWFYHRWLLGRKDRPFEVDLISVSRPVNHDCGQRDGRGVLVFSKAVK